MSENIWFYAQDGRQIGPVPLDDILSRAANGELKADDLVWSEGMESWTPASSVPGLIPGPAPAPEPRPAPIPPARSRRGSWKLVAMFAAVALLFLGASFWRRTASPSIDALVGIVPRDADALLVLRGMPHFARELGLVGGGEAALLTVLSDFGGLGEWMDTQPGSILDTGIDVAAPVGLSVQGGVEQILVYYLPVGDSARLRATLERFADQKGWSLEEQEVGGRPLLTAQGGAFGAVEHRGYLVAANTLDHTPVAPFFEKLIGAKADSVAQAEWFSSMSALRKGPWHFLALLDPSTFAPLLSDELPTPWASRSAELAGVGMRLEITGDEMRLRYQEASRPGTEHGLHRFAAAGQDRFADRIAEDALAVLRFSVDLSPLGEDRPDLDSWTAVLVELGLLGPSAAGDFTGALGSPISVAILEGDAEAEIPVDVVAWAPLKRGHDMPATLERIAESADGSVDTIEDEDGTSWYHSQGLSWTGVDGHVVMALRSSDGAVFSGSGPSLLSSLRRPELRKEIVSQHDAMAYVDLESAIELLLLADLGEDLQEKDKALFRSLGDLTIWVDAQPHTLVSEWTVLARQPGGFADAVAAREKTKN